MYVIKASGEREEFDANKILRTCLRAGASRKFAEEVVREVERCSYNGISTLEVLDLTLHLLKREPGVSSRYDLKRAIMCLGPTGFPFEHFFAEVLERYGYKTEVGKIFEGKCVNQEVDVFAKKGKIRYMVECKYHNEPGIYTGLKVAMYTYARFLDLEGQFDKAWLVCNTKLTYEAVKYATGMGVKVTSWRYPGEESLEKLVEKKKLYPITILKSLDVCEKNSMIRANFLLIEDLLDHGLLELKKKTKLKKKVLEKAVEETEHILG